MSDDTPEIKALLKALAGNWLPDDDDLAEAPIVDHWAFLMSATGRHLQLTGKVVGSRNFGTGESLVTSAVAEVPPGGGRKWIKTQNTLYRLGWPAGEAWPPYLQVAANPDWFAAFEAARHYTAEHTLTPDALLASQRAGHLENGKPNWAFWKAECNLVARSLKDAGRDDVARAWWILATDLISERDRNFAEPLFANFAVTREMSPEEKSAISGWNTLAGCTDESIHDYGDINDPIAAAHRAAAADMEAEDSRELARRDARALPFFVALEPNHRRARQRVMEAVRSVLTGDDVGDLLLAADAIADQEDDAAAANLVVPFMRYLTTWGLANNVKRALSDHELHRALFLVSAMTYERMIDPAFIKSAFDFIRQAAGEAVDLGLISKSRAQLTVCAWGLMVLGATAIGQDQLDHTDDPFAMVHRIADRLTYDIRVAGPSPFPPAVAAHFAARTSRKAEAEGPVDGVMVMAAAGGTTETTSGKEVVREFKKLIGKRLPVTPVPDLVVARAALAAEFPYAMTQIDVILGDLAGADAVRLRPTLLTGEPGGGKSRLARRLAEVLKVGLHRFDAAGSSDNAFGGTPRRWSSGEHAVPLEAIRRYEIANPIVLVDEIDKAGRSRHNGSLAEALMPFMEQETSRNFPDPFIQTDVDLSHVSYILTANRDEDLPGPLKDRLRILRLPRPTIEHLPALARGIVADVARERGGDVRWWPPLDEGELDVAEQLWAGGSVRKLRSVVERILAYREQNPRH
jgi:hypothetical protein